MGRIRLGRFKIEILVFFFFFILAGAFIWMLSWLHHDISQLNTGGNTVYLLTQNDYQNIMENNGAMVFRSEQAVRENTYRQQTLQMVHSKLFPFSLAFLTVIFAASILLWFLLRSIQRRDILRIVNELNMVADTDILTDNPKLSAAYAKIRLTMEKHLNDYKRLNSYLSHEQKNSLAILRTNLELSGHTDCLELIDGMTDGINDILTLSENPDDGAPSTVDVALVCAEVCDRYRSLSTKITFDFDEDDNSQIEGRQRWVYRAVANLLDNAIKYGNEKPIHLSVYTQKGSVIVRIKDHGIGISSEKQENIFSHHYRIDELNRDGYGIGLSLVAHVCNLCGGFVTVESEVGKGSTFYLSFPQKLS